MVHNALQMRLIFSGNVAAAFREDDNIDSIILTLISLTMNPAIVLGHIFVNTIKLTTAMGRN